MRFFDKHEYCIFEVMQFLKHCNFTG